MLSDFGIMIKRSSGSGYMGEEQYLSRIQQLEVAQELTEITFG